MTRDCYAKINLGLRILRRRKDGYHDIETVFVRIAMADTLRFEPASKFDFSCSDKSLPVDESNLVVRAVRLFERQFGAQLNGRVHLEKQIPHAAGLGGGSSDAAGMLHLCSEISGVDDAANGRELMQIAAKLGADVPFFLTTGVQVGRGTGTDLMPLRTKNGRDYALPFAIVVVVPDVHVGTAEAYSGIRPRPVAKGEATVAEIVLSNDPERWRRELVNDFEPNVLAAFPQIRRVRDQMAEAGAVYAALSGSGSAVFGLFESSAAASTAADTLRGNLPTQYVTWVGAPITSVD